MGRAFAPWKRVYAYLLRREKAWVPGVWSTRCAAGCRVALGRDPGPTAAIVDSQSVRAAAAVGAGTRGWDGGRRVTGRKRHVAVDTLDLLICVFASPANVQDRDAARVLLSSPHLVCPTVTLVWVGRRRIRRAVGEDRETVLVADRADRQAQ